MTVFYSISKCGAGDQSWPRPWLLSDCLWLGGLKKIIQEILSKCRVSGLCSRGSESVSQSKAWECAFPRALHMTLMCSRVQESATLSVIIVANSKEGWFCPISGDRFGCCIKDCYWHSVDRNQACFWTSYSAHDGPFQQGIIRLWVSTELRLRSPVSKCAHFPWGPIAPFSPDLLHSHQDRMACKSFGDAIPSLNLDHLNHNLYAHVVLSEVEVSRAMSLWLLGHLCSLTFNFHLPYGIKPRSPALQADSLPAEPQGKPNYDSDLDKSLGKVWLLSLSLAVLPWKLKEVA